MTSFLCTMEKGEGRGGEEEGKREERRSTLVSLKRALILMISFTFNYFLRGSFSKYSHMRGFPHHCLHFQHNTNWLQPSNMTLENNLCHILDYLHMFSFICLVGHIQYITLIFTITFTVKHSVKWPRQSLCPYWFE